MVQFSVWVTIRFKYALNYSHKNINTTVLLWITVSTTKNIKAKHRDVWLRVWLLLFNKHNSCTRSVDLTTSHSLVLISSSLKQKALKEDLEAHFSAQTIFAPQFNRREIAKCLQIYFVAEFQTICTGFIEDVLYTGHNKALPVLNKSKRPTLVDPASKFHSCGSYMYTLHETKIINSVQGF